MSDLLNSASLVMVPSGYKEDTVYSVVPSDGSGDLSFTRASDGTRINSAGLVEVAPWNLLQYSEDFSNAAWTKTGGASITANDTTAPNGTLTADKINLAASIYSGAYQFISQPRGVYANSIYAKAGTFNYLFVLINGSSGYYVWFNLTTGTVGSKGSNMDGIIESVGNGWYRCTASRNLNNDTNDYHQFGFSDAENFTPTTTGTGYIWGAQLNIGSTAKPYFPTTDRLNVPRLTYQNGGGGCPSLLLEKQSTNGLYPSEDFSTTWLLFNSATVTTNQATSPDGTQNADKLTTTNQGTAIYNVNGAGASAQAYTASLFIKYIDNTEFAIGMTDDVTGEAFARFNFTTGTATTTLQGDWTSISYAWEQQANGWYRISVTATKGASGNARFIGKGGGAYNYYIWGAQVEASSYKTSYIPTTSSSATRVADVCYKTGISSLIGQTEGVMFIDTYVGNETDEVYGWLQASLSGNPNNSIQINRASSSIQAQIYNGSTPTALITGGTISKGQRIKVAFAYKLNDCVLYLNGTQIGVDTSTAIPTCAVFQLGAYPPLPNDYTNDGGINQAILFPTRLTNAELASLTTI